VTQTFKERREFQRLALEEPVTGSFASQQVKIVEIGVLGARVMHEASIEEGTSGSLRFEWNGSEAELDCHVVRTEHAPGSHEFVSGLRFAGAIGESDRTVRELLESKASVLLDRFHSALREPAPDVEFDDDDTLKGKEAGFVTYYMYEGEWHKRYSMLPDQPESGFTVAVGEDELEMKRLRHTYEEADTQGMQLIRLFAELSIAEAMGLPWRSQD